MDERCSENFCGTHFLDRYGNTGTFWGGIILEGLDIGREDFLILGVDKFARRVHAESRFVTAKL